MQAAHLVGVLGLQRDERDVVRPRELVDERRLGEARDRLDEQAGEVPPLATLAERDGRSEDVPARADVRDLRVVRIAGVLGAVDEDRAPTVCRLEDERPLVRVDQGVVSVSNDNGSIDVSGGREAVSSGAAIEVIQAQVNAIIAEQKGTFAS